MNPADAFRGARVRAGRQVGDEDVFTKIEMCRRHHAQAGLGAGYVDAFVR